MNVSVDVAKCTGLCICESMAPDVTDPGVEAPIPFFRSDDVFADELKVELVLGAPATGLDVKRKIVFVGAREVGYDALVIATGSQLRTLPGSEHLDGVHGLRTLD